MNRANEEGTYVGGLEDVGEVDEGVLSRGLAVTVSHEGPSGLDGRRRVDEGAVHVEEASLGRDGDRLGHCKREVLGFAGEERGRGVVGGRKEVVRSFPSFSLYLLAPASLGPSV